MTDAAATPSWTSWGATQPELSRTARRTLHNALGALTPAPPLAIEAPRVAPSRLSGAARAALVEALGAGGVQDHDEILARHAGGQSYVDIVRRRSGDAGDAPDVVLIPDTTSQVAAVLDACTRTGTALVTWGGG